MTCTWLRTAFETLAGLPDCNPPVPWLTPFENARLATFHVPKRREEWLLGRFTAKRLVSEADVIFLALPEAASAELAPTLLERGARVIDLSGAFRIRSAPDRQRWYPATTDLPEGTVYGLTEGHQAEIRSVAFALR